MNSVCCIINKKKVQYFYVFKGIKILQPIDLKLLHFLTKYCFNTYLKCIFQPKKEKNEKGLTWWVILGIVCVNDNPTKLQPACYRLVVMSLAKTRQNPCCRAARVHDVSLSFGPVVMWLI